MSDRDLLASIVRADAPAPTRLRLLEVYIESPTIEGSTADIAAEFGWSTSATGDVIALGEKLGYITRSTKLTASGRPCLQFVAAMTGAMAEAAVLAADDAVTEAVLTVPGRDGLDAAALARSLADAGIPESMGQPAEVTT